MKIKHIVLTALLASLASIIPSKSRAFDITGGNVWKERKGPGIIFSVGLNSCTQDYCQRDLGVGASIGGAVGFQYLVIPNLVLFADTQLGHIPIDYEAPLDAGPDKDNGFVFQTVGGAAFNFPMTGWLGMYLGVGMGFSLFATFAHYDNGDDYRTKLGGFDIQMRTGADFFPFSRAPNFSLGPTLYLGFPVWTKACQELNTDEDCDEPDDSVFIDRRHRDNLPSLFYIGIVGKIWF